MTHAVLIIQFVKLYTTFACQVINDRILISLFMQHTSDSRTIKEHTRALLNKYSYTSTDHD